MLLDYQPSSALMTPTCPTLETTILPLPMSTLMLDPITLMLRESNFPTMEWFTSSSEKIPSGPEHQPSAKLRKDQDPMDFPLFTTECWLIKLRM